MKFYYLGSNIFQIKSNDFYFNFEFRKELIEKLSDLSITDSENIEKIDLVEEKKIVFIINEYIEEENSFLSYHKTGTIREELYNTDRESYSFRFENYPVEIFSFKTNDGEDISFRQSGERNKYVVKDSSGEIVKDSSGNAIFLSDKEACEKKLPIFETSVIAFNSNKICIGYSSDEWGVDGVWVVDSYQKKGIGSKLIELLRNQFRSKNGANDLYWRDSLQVFFSKKEI